MHRAATKTHKPADLRRRDIILGEISKGKDEDGYITSR